MKEAILPRITRNRQDIVSLPTNERGRGFEFKKGRILFKTHNNTIEVDKRDQCSCTNQ